MNSIEMIKELSSAFGPSGFEDDVIKIAKRYLPAEYKTERDSLNNLYMHREQKKAGALTVLVEAHSDEVGLMVHHIKSNGTICFTTLGSWPASALPSQKVLIKNTEGDFITGIVAIKPPHFVQGAEPVPNIEDMVIDIGACSKEEVIEHYKISPACPIVPQTEFEYFVDEDIMMNKAFDCRLGCAAVLEVLTRLKDTPLDINLVGALSSQEEVGLRGAKVAANKVQPDACIIFEGTPADDTFLEPDKIQTAIKKGPMLRHLDKSMITNPRFIKYATDIGKKEGIAFQEAVRLGGGTNGGAYQMANLGIPCIVIGHPVRYIHSHNSLATLGDFKKGVELACAIIKSLNTEVIQKF